MGNGTCKLFFVRGRARISSLARQSWTGTYLRVSRCLSRSRPTLEERNLSKREIIVEREAKRAESDLESLHFSLFSTPFLPSTVMDARYALSRSEEENLIKRMKADSLKHCEIPVSGKSCLVTPPSPKERIRYQLLIHDHRYQRTAFAKCGEGRTVSVVWACREQFSAMNACMATQYVTLEAIGQLNIICAE